MEHGEGEYRRGRVGEECGETFIGDTDLFLESGGGSNRCDAFGYGLVPVLSEPEFRMGVEEEHREVRVAKREDKLAEPASEHPGLLEDFVGGVEKSKWTGR